MRIDRIVRALADPWHIRQEVFWAVMPIAAAASSFLRDGRIVVDSAAVKEQAERTGSRKLSDQVLMLDAVAVVPLYGVLGIGWDEWELAAGGIDVLEVEETVRALMESAEVEAIVLDFDSPGGMHQGTVELAEYLAEAKVEKPIFSFTRTMMCSAAYYLAAGTDAIYASKSAVVGSIGTYIPMMDMSGLYEKLGLKAEVIADGKYKGAGYPGTSLSKEQRAQLQDVVNYASRAFKNHVLQYRRDVAEETMQGQAFWGEQGPETGLTDSVATLGQTIGDVRKYAALTAVGE